MEVCTKLLDVKNLNKVQLKILKTIGIWFVTFIISLALLVNLNKNEHIEILVDLLFFIPVMIHVIFISRKAKKNEWVSKKFEIEAYENKLYLNKRSIFVNLDKTNNKIYIDNIYDDYMNSYDTTFCGYIDEKDSEKFLEFLKENNITIGVINAELLIYRYKNLSVPGKYNNLSRILKNRPEQLVSQGDCFLWDCLEDSFKVMPWNSGELKIKELIYYKYKKLTSEDLSLDSKVHIEKAMHYGLYFGNVNGEFWIKYGIPQIIKNYRICNRKLEFAMLSPFILILIIFGVLVGLGVIT